MCIRDRQLARAGHDVTVYEKNDRIGGLLRYGIPDFKLEKQLIDQRMKQMEVEGVTFKPYHYIGKATDPAVTKGLAVITPEALKAEYDAIVLSGGSETPRDLPVQGRELDGVMYAMDFLRPQNKVVAGDKVEGQVLAKGKHVVVILSLIHISEPTRPY